jgi:hypothetical protein
MACRLQIERARRIEMIGNAERKTQKRFWDIPSAAHQAGYSSRHFRRIIEEDGIPVMQIGRKFFILGRDFENWQLTHGHSKTNQPMEQVS